MTATLLLSGTYATDLGQSISGDFVSFTYNGSNLLGAFTITSGSPGLSVSGTLQISPTIPTLSISDTAPTVHGRLVRGHDDTLRHWVAGHRCGRQPDDPGAGHCIHRHSGHGGTGRFGDVA
ncbi:MAG TPA: hypothetical protein VGN17_30920 [Bryobacteraceae bacterium]